MDLSRLLFLSSGLSILTVSSQVMALQRDAIEHSDSKFLEDTDSQMSLSQAITNGNTAKIEELLEIPENLNSQSSNGSTPLHTAVGKRDLDTINKLLSKKADVSLMNQEGNNPFHLATKLEYIDALDAFLNYDPALMESKNKEGLAALHIAASNGLKSIVEYFVNRGANKEIETEKRKETPLHWACFTGHLEVVKYLISAGANTSTLTSQGATILHQACCAGHLKVIKFLVDEKHLDVDVRSPKGLTPLQTACFTGHLEVVKYLINAGANIEEGNNSQKWTPLSLACGGGHIEIARYLMALINSPERVRERGETHPKSFLPGSTLSLTDLNGYLLIDTKTFSQEGADFLLQQDGNWDIFEMYRIIDDRSSDKEKLDRLKARLPLVIKAAQKYKQALYEELLKPSAGEPPRERPQIVLEAIKQINGEATSPSVVSSTPDVSGAAAGGPGL